MTKERDENDERFEGLSKEEILKKKEKSRFLVKFLMILKSRSSISREQRIIMKVTYLNF